MSSDESSPGTTAVAVTGGIGAGKSEALRAFARYGAEVASADEIVHRLYERDDVKRELVARWGEGVLAADRSIDRSRVGEIVFADRAELEWLEGILHPRVVAEQARWREEVERGADPPAVLVVEVPLLYETGAEERFDAVVVITAPEAVRRERTAVQDPAARARRLLPDEEKSARADFAYVNDGSLDALDAFVRGVMAALSSR